MNCKNLLTYWTVEGKYCDTIININCIGNITIERSKLMNLLYMKYFWLLYSDFHGAWLGQEHLQFRLFIRLPVTNLQHFSIKCQGNCHDIWNKNVLKDSRKSYLKCVFSSTFCLYHRPQYAFCPVLILTNKGCHKYARIKVCFKNKIWMYIYNTLHPYQTIWNLRFIKAMKVSNSTFMMVIGRPC